MNIRNILFGLAGLFLICGESQAACSLVGNPYGAKKVQFNINIGTVFGAGTAPVGAVLASYTQTAPSKTLINASNYLACQLNDLETFTPSMNGGAPVAGFPMCTAPTWRASAIASLIRMASLWRLHNGAIPTEQRAVRPMAE